jgi:hypothetical protein
MLLGTFQFDYRPEPGQTHIIIQAEYNQNGVLNLQIQQPSSMVTFPLNQISKLEGKKINPPSTTVPIMPPVVQEAPGGFSGGFGFPPAAPPRLDWTQEDLDNGIRFGNRILEITRQRIAHASVDDKVSLEELMRSLKQWINNSFEDINTRSPQIRNYNRSLLFALYTSRLINADEMRELQKGSD